MINIIVDLNKTADRLCRFLNRIFEYIVTK